VILRILSDSFWPVAAPGRKKMAISDFKNKPILYFGLIGVVIGAIISFAHALILSWSAPLIINIFESSASVTPVQIILINLLTTIVTSFPAVLFAATIIVLGLKERRPFFGIVPSLVILALGYRQFLTSPSNLLNYWSVEPVHAVNYFLIHIVVVAAFYGAFMLAIKLSKSA